MNTFMKSRRLYSNRSASQLALGHNNEGLVDALKARYSANNHDSLIHCVLKRSACVVARSCSNFLFAFNPQVAKAHLDQGIIPRRPGVHATEAV